MQPIRFILIGGFLGAGKTTAIAHLARAYQARGQSVAIITNDHASELVDTHNLRSQGFHVGEIPGACFCGSLDDLTSAVDSLEILGRPDVVLVEPVGSCTDLAASVIRPLRRQCPGRFEVAPYVVLLKPAHGIKILRGRPAGFSPQAEYIFRKQLEEADLVAINRIDQLAPSQVEELERLLTEQYPGIPVLRASAKMGLGMDAMLELLDQQGDFGNRLLEVDYDKYAAGEAELGWLNGTFLLRGACLFNLDQFLLEFVTALRDSLASAAAETAHLKAIGLWEGSHAVVNLISSDSQPELSRSAGRNTPQAHLIMNARVALDPALLQSHVVDALRRTCTSFRLEISDRHVQSFRPGRPAVPKLVV